MSAPSAAVLLVEDNADDAYLLLTAFREFGFPRAIEVASDGEEALLRLEAEASPGPKASPALVILDLNLPKIGGMEVLRRIRAQARLKALPVLVLTTSTQERERDEALRLGASAFLNKPMRYEEYRGIAEQAVRLLP
ncbi:MAG TPA: response regulator [Elusimicrobiota bacterium]|jgi:two-component system response regulator|nr:response regulator [Elusimicrobiota bacterium]